MTSELDPFRRALEWRAQGRAVALATVLETWGSSPRRVGSVAAFDEDGRMAGSVSGGCVEAAVAAEAERVFTTGEPRQLTFSVEDRVAWGVGLACGGTVRIHLESVTKDRTLAPLLDAAERRSPAARLLDLGTGLAAALVDGRVLAGFGLTAAQLQAAEARIATDASGIVEGEETRIFVQALAPAPRLVIVGAVHIAQALAPMAALAGFAVTVIDPRGGFASAERFPGTDLIADWPDAALAALAPDRRTAIAVLSHDPKLDDPALVAALRSEAGYVGALGSTRTQAARRERLGETHGFAAHDLARLHGPIGLAIGAATPGEIAVAILAQAIKALRGA